MKNAFQKVVGFGVLHSLSWMCNCLTMHVDIRCMLDPFPNTNDGEK